MKNSTKKTEKILGIVYTVGTKAHAIALQTLKNIQQLQNAN